jgi:stringent starvation protein B
VFDTKHRMSSTKPYLIRALHEWCTDNGFTPHIAVSVDASVEVPAQFVVKGEIVLNVGHEATGGLQIGNELITFKARFGGIPREIKVPIQRVLAIYARENGDGMAFPVQSVVSASEREDGASKHTSVTADAVHRGLSLVSSESKPMPEDTDPPPVSPTPSPSKGLRRIK